MRRGPWKHGHCSAGKTSSTWMSWTAMRQRTGYNAAGQPRYQGVKVCMRWQKFENFLSDMGLRPKGRTLGRINGSLGYCKSNCRWETPTDQSLNRRAWGASGIRGAYLHKKTGLYEAAITIDGKRRYLGLFKTRAEAGRVAAMARGSR